MRWTTSGILLGILWVKVGLSPHFSWAQTLPGTDPISPSRPSTHLADFTSTSDPSSRPIISSATLLKQRNLTSFRLILGRLQLDPVRYRKGQMTASHKHVEEGGSSETVIQEQLNVTSQRGRPSVHYDLQSQGLKLAIDAVGDGDLRIVMQRLVDGKINHLTLWQPEHGELRLERWVSSISDTTVAGIDGDRTCWEGGTLLHLREADRYAFAQDLAPLLDQLLEPYHFESLCDQSLELAMHRVDDLLVPQSDVYQWIQDLSHPQRSARVMAERNLVSVGVGLLPTLTSIDATRLDGEQRARLAQIQRKLVPRGEDTAARLATVIRDDADYWTAVSSRLDVHDRGRIVARFNASGRAIDFNIDQRVAALPGSLVR